MAAIDDLIRMDRESPRRILVIGDAMTDVYVHGRIEECQEGCPKFVRESHTTVPGGAANAARSLQHWSAKVECPCERVASPVKTRLMVDNRCVFRFDDDTCTLAFGRLREHLLVMLTSYRPHAVLLSDYDKGLLTPDFLRQVIDICTTRKIPCVADAKREPNLYRGAIIKGNALYFSKYAERARTTTSQAISTNGQYTPVVWDSGKVSAPFFSSNATPCINHVGAGDCFAAHLTLALAYGFSLDDAVAIAHSAGRVYVTRPHNEPPRPEEIAGDVASAEV